VTITSWSASPPLGTAARSPRLPPHNSIFRADDEMLVNPQVRGIAAAYAPALHLRRVKPSGMFAAYADCLSVCGPTPLRS
jgi:hypothetical protein